MSVLTRRGALSLVGSLGASLAAGTDLSATMPPLPANDSKPSPFMQAIAEHKAVIAESDRLNIILDDLEEEHPFPIKGVMLHGGPLPKFVRTHKQIDAWADAWEESFRRLSPDKDEGREAFRQRRQALHVDLNAQLAELDRHNETCGIAQLDRECTAAQHARDRALLRVLASDPSTTSDFRALLGHLLDLRRSREIDLSDECVSVALTRWASHAA